MDTRLVSISTPSASNKIKTGILNIETTISLTAGTYYFRATTDSYATGTGPYTFTIGEPSPTTCTVTFNANGGTVSPASKTVNAGESITLPSASRSGFRFLGWAERSGASSPTYNAGDSFTVNGNVTLYAVWQAASGPTEVFIISLDPNGGAVSGDISYIKPFGTVIFLPSATRSGYTFVGWSETVDGVESTYAAGTSYTVTHSAVLRAKWEQQRLTFFQRLQSFFAAILNFFRTVFGGIC